MSVTQFNNNLYEKNGCRFFEVNELEAMEDISNTSSWQITLLVVAAHCWWMFRIWKTSIASTCLIVQCVHQLPVDGRHRYSESTGRRSDRTSRSGRN
jgi:hypothetical protein